MSLDNLILVNKPYGATPLETIQALRRLGILSENEKATYAGRLDPLATGLLLILKGEGVHEKEKYLALEKTYEIDLVFGAATDTGDLVGVPHAQESAAPQPEEIAAHLESISEGEYPAFSSKTVNGKALHEYAREGVQIPRPSRPMRYSVTHASKAPAITSKNLISQISTACELVKGDFRQTEILSAWKALKLPENLAQYTFTINATSGTYMRAIPEIIQKKFGTVSVVTRITRTKIGDLDLKNKNVVQIH